MKRLVLLLAVLSLPAAAFAAASTIPLNISYQGRVSDAGGNLIGDPTPVNRVITFRIWNHATDAAAGNRLYSEQQTVTIAKGEFSVLIGLGTAVSGEAKPALDTVFTGLDRFLGITVDDGTTTVDPEISPRQQLVSAPFAFRAKVAEAVLGQSVDSTMLANNAVTTVQLADAAVTNAKLVASSVDTTKLANVSVTNAKIADGSVNSIKIADGTIATADIAAGAVTQAKLGSDVGFWSTSLGNVYRGTGNVGINTGWPAALLSVGGNLLNSKILVMDDGNAGNNMGFGSQSNQFRFHVGNSAARFSFLNEPGASAELVTFTGAGKVGIGISGPVNPLQVHTATTDSRMSFTHSATGSSSGDGLVVGIDTIGAFVWNHEALPLQLGTSNAQRLRIEADGRMGFNGTNSATTIGYSFKSSGEYLMVLYDRFNVWSYSFHEAGSAVKPGGGSWGNSSDVRLKKNIADLSGSLDRLLRLRSVTYDYKDERYGKGRHTGFIAQEVREIFPDWVTVERDGFLAVGTKGFEAQAVEAFRELRAEKDAQIAALQAQVKELKGETAQRLDALERRMNAATITANSPR